MIEQSSLSVVAKADDRGHCIHPFELRTQVMTDSEQNCFHDVNQSSSSATRPAIPSSIGHSIISFQ